MSKLKKLLRQTEFQLLLFCVYFVLICLPFLVFQNPSHAVNMYALDMFVYFFIVWGMVIAILYLVSRNSADPPDRYVSDEGGN